MGVVSKYWPTAAGIAALAVGWFVLKPTDTGVSNRAITGQITAEQGRTDSEEPDEEDEEDDRFDEREEKRTKVDRGDPSKVPPAASAETEYLMVEKVIAVPLEGEPGEIREFKTEDPEVQSALREVDVVLWRTEGCKHCKAAARFLDHNKVSYQSRDISNLHWKEKLRRLSGGSSVPVIEVDGAMVRGFSESSLQGALTDAVRNRIASSD